MNREPVSILRATGINYSYACAASPAVCDVSFSVGAGETLVLVGANGSGKTTLLSCAAGIFDANASCRIFSYEAAPSALKLYRSRIGFLFQNPDDQFFMPTVFEDVAFALDRRRFSDDQIKEKVSRVLSSVGFNGSAPCDSEPRHLSFGEKKRVALAGALVNDPELLFLDEPTLGLDPPSKRNFILLIKNIVSAKIVATHDFSVARALADKVLFLERGRTAFYGAARDFFDSGVSARFFGETLP